MSHFELEKLPNIGEKSASWLEAIGIETTQDLEQIGIVPAYCLLKAQGYPVTANLLYALYGALHNISWQKVPLETKTSLLKEVEGFRFG